jgi:Mrp family chromosome partitioning ATPase
MITLTATPAPPKRGVNNRIVNEQYDALACWLQSSAMLGSAGCKTIGVTCCERGAGVSTVATNLAVAAAQNYDQPVLLMNVSGASKLRASRRPITHSAVLNKNFSSDSSLSQYVAESRIDNLSLLTVDTADAAQAARLGGRQVIDTLHELERDFGFIVIDLPPANTGLCFAVSGTLSGVLLVVEAGRTDGEAAILARKRLMQANADVLGVILNKYSNGSFS